MSVRLRAGSLLSSFGRTAGVVIGNSSIGIKLVCVTVIISYCLSFSEAAIEALSVTPGYFWPPHFHFWTALTHCYLEIHWWEVVVDILTLILVGKLLEPLWGALEMITFFVVVNAGVAIVCGILYNVLFMITTYEGYLFDVHVHGLAGYLAGVSVAVKQAMPDHVLYRSPMGKFTNRNIPLTVFSLSFVLWAIGMVEGSYCTMFGSGLVISWTYLRFYQMHANGSRGDTADGFAFASFFPNVVQPPLAAAGNAVFAILVKLRVCKRPIRRYDVGGASLGVGGGVGASGPSISISLPGAENHDTERRRQIALKALSDRLGKADAESPAPASTAWPTLDDPTVAKPVEESSEAQPLLEVHGASTPRTTTPDDSVSIDVSTEGGDSKASQQGQSS